MGIVLPNNANGVTEGRRSKCGGLECCLAPPQLGDSPSVLLGSSSLKLFEHTHTDQTPNKNTNLDQGYPEGGYAAKNYFPKSLFDYQDFGTSSTTVVSSEHEFPFSIDGNSPIEC